MPLEDFDTPADWRRDLDRRWPERLDIREQLIAEVSTAIEATSGRARVVELGAGDGDLALRLQKAHPTIVLTAVDRNATLCEHGRAAGGGIEWVCADLTDKWPSSLAESFDVAYSLQTFHDLGGRDVLAMTYRRLRESMASDGVFVHADFVEPLLHDDPSKPRRFAPEVHLELFTDAGFAATLTLRRGLLGCFVARAA